MRIEPLTADQLIADLPGLCALLEDTVEGGASIGFLWPMSEGESERYWRSLVPAIAAGERFVLTAFEEVSAHPEERGAERSASRRFVGTGALELATRPNSTHRAEVSKLMTLRSHRNQGIGRAVMLALEDEARRLNRTTLTLDTILDGGAEPLYRSLGWTEAGRIPLYAAYPDGRLDTTVYYYKLLEERTTLL